MTKATETRKEVTPGEAVLTCDADGLCQPSTICTPHPYAYPTRRDTVHGWGSYDGEDRQWYRLGVDGPETAYEVCWPVGA